LALAKRWRGPPAIICQRSWANPIARDLGISSTFVFGARSGGLIIAGWDGVRKAWEMRFSQFDQVTVSSTESYVRSNGHVAWAVGIEKVQLLRKNGDTLSFDAFVTTCSRTVTAHGVSPGNSDLQGAQVVRVPTGAGNHDTGNLLIRIQ
jgi:hypothetical protein